VLTYRERVGALRAALYAKQIECYDRILVALSELQEIAIAETTGKRLPLDDQARAKLRETAQPQFGRLAHAFVANVPFLPKAVAGRRRELRDTFAAISAPPAAVHIYKQGLAYARNPQAVLPSRPCAFGTMRLQLGTDPLDQQTLRLFGSPPRAD
jgi:hypothetical protein